MCHYSVVVGTLYPAYCSYKAIQLARSSKNANEMVRYMTHGDVPVYYYTLQGHWLMYWIVYALFSLAETFADTLVSWYVIKCDVYMNNITVITRIPFYYELKLLFVFWLVLPITKVSGNNGTLLLVVCRAPDICIRSLFIHTLRSMSRWVGLCRSCDDGNVSYRILTLILIRPERKD